MSSQGKYTMLFMTFFFLAASFLAPFVHSQTTSNTIVAVTQSSTTATKGQTITANITISNVQNLYGVEVTLDWNSSVLTIISATPQLGVATYPQGVLHMPINLVQSNFTESEYQLVATSIAPGAAFYGSGVLAVVTFNVTSSGSSPLTLKSELADYNPQGSEDIVHTNQSGSVTVTVIPEFPGTTILVLFLALATAAMLLTAKQLNKKRVATGLKRLKTIS